MGSLFLVGPSSTRADTVVANAMTRKVNERDTKTFPKCYVVRNGKRNEQKLHIQKHTDLGAMTKFQQIMVAKQWLRHQSWHPSQ